MLARKWKKGDPCKPLVGMQIGVATIENNMEVPQKIKNRATTWLRRIQPSKTESGTDNLKRLRISSEIEFVI